MEIVTVNFTFLKARLASNPQFLCSNFKKKPRNYCFWASHSVWYSFQSLLSLPTFHLAACVAQIPSREDVGLKKGTADSSSLKSRYPVFERLILGLVMLKKLMEMWEKKGGGLSYFNSSLKSTTFKLPPLALYILDQNAEVYKPSDKNTECPFSH